MEHVVMATRLHGKMSLKQMKTKKLKQNFCWERTFFIIMHSHDTTDGKWPPGKWQAYQLKPL